MLEVTGNLYPLYGADFFDNLQNTAANVARSPVGEDYVLGPGDQLRIRIWGSTSGETSVTIDRNGEIALPKMGNLQLAGVRYARAESLVKAQFARYYKDFELSVTLGRLRKITVYVVGQSRAPGSYSLGSQSTLTNALFASGGPNAIGSLRKVQLKRSGAVVAEFDLYHFLSKGDKSADVKLMDGDVIVYPRASGYVAFTGKVNAPGIYEIRDPGETVEDFLALAGGLPVVADPRRITLERLAPGVDQPRRMEAFALDAQGLKKSLRNGDILSVPAIVAELANGVSLRGHVAQPTRVPWRAGMRVSDLITSKAMLINPESLRRQNELLFDGFQQERSARSRLRVPLDLALERMDQADEGGKPKAEAAAPAKPAPDAANAALDAIMGRDRQGDAARTAANRSTAMDAPLVERIGSMVDEINFEYAVIERLGRDDLRTSVIQFNLGRVMNDPKDRDNLALEPGDVVTVFSVKDVRIPQSKRRVLVRVEGEVDKPGVYQVAPGENLGSIIQKAGGLTPDAYLFGMGFYREEVRQSQRENLDKLLRRLESESSGKLAQAAQSAGASAAAGSAQLKVQALQMAQLQALSRVRALKPEGRIALGLPSQIDTRLEALPALRLQSGDRIHLPARPDFVYIFGAVNTESALLFKKGLAVADYLQLAGSGAGADQDGVILIRADGSALTNREFWRNEVLASMVMPGDTIVLPEKLDRESSWSVFLRNTKDITQVIYQLGIGVAAVKVLRQ